MLESTTQNCWSETWSTLADWATLLFFFSVNWYHSEQRANCNHCNLRVWSLGSFQTDPENERYRYDHPTDEKNILIPIRTVQVLFISFVVVVPQVRVTQCQSCFIAIYNVFNIFVLQSPRFFLLQKYIVRSGIVVKNVWWYPQHMDLRSTPV